MSTRPEYCGWNRPKIRARVRWAKAMQAEEVEFSEPDEWPEWANSEAAQYVPPKRAYSEDETIGSLYQRMLEGIE